MALLVPEHGREAPGLVLGPVHRGGARVHDLDRAVGSDRAQRGPVPSCGLVCSYNVVRYVNSMIPSRRTGWRRAGQPGLPIQCKQKRVGGPSFGETLIEPFLGEAP